MNREIMAAIVGLALFIAPGAALAFSLNIHVSALDRSRAFERARIHTSPAPSPSPSPTPTPSPTPPTPSPQGIFATGAVTLRFDDNWQSQYDNAVPILNSANMKATFYVVSRQTLDNDFIGFMSVQQIKTLASQGHEIGAHSRTHAHLTKLSTSRQRDEIQGSRQDILSWDIGPVSTFAYPYGEYTSQTMQIVKDAGFTSAAATIDGHTSAMSDRYQLERRPVDKDISVSQVKKWIDEAATQKKWLILNFHRIEKSSDHYSTTPPTFNAIVEYLKQKGIPVVTISQGVQSLQ